MTSSGNEDLIADYLGEAHDYIEQLNATLMELSEGGGAWPEQRVNELFRTAHSLKGLSACFGFETTNTVTHHLESLLSKVRDGVVQPNTKIARTMFDAIDAITHLTAEIAAGGAEGSAHAFVVESLRYACENEAGGESGAEGPSLPSETPRPAAGDEHGDGPARRTSGEANETVRVRMERLDRMVNLTGELVIARSRFQLVAQNMRPLARLEDSSLTWREIESTFEELQERLGAIESRAAREALQDVAERFGEQFQRMRGCWRDLQGATRSLRDLDDVAYDLDSVVGGIHEAVLQLRMVPLDSVFRRLQRVVRDTAESLDKPIDFRLSGGDTQIDKRVADELVNPLVHMLRNSIDHGIEPRQVREQSGKASCGTVCVRSFQRGSSVVIEIEDDGGGIDPGRMAEKVVEMGLMSADEAAVMTPREAQRQIFHPGFSTAAQVTEVSGRGMGMDIVAATIKGLRGSLELESTVGQGTKFVIELPPSMSILTSLLIEVRGTMFALPLTEVREIVELAGARVQTVQSQPVVVVRDQPMPFVQLPQTYRFAEKADAPAGAAPEHAVVFGHAGGEVALGVDRLVGKEDLVIKPLCAELTAVPGLAGMAIRGDGKVTLILDPTGFAEFAMSRQRARAVRDANVPGAPVGT